MESVNISNQTLREFLDKPFNRDDFTKKTQYEARYLAYKRNNKIKLGGILKLDESYFIHIKVPSESSKKINANSDVYYDVVVQFFTDKPELIRGTHIKKYYVQFFSNSPGFLYKYAALYKLEGYLIESLIDKFQPGILEVLPDKANKNYELAYDSSIYYACRYIWDNKLNLFGKLYLNMWRKRNAKDFFDKIQSFEDLNTSRDIANLEKQIKREIATDNGKLTVAARLKIRTHNDDIRKQIADKKGITKANKKLSKISTFKDPSKNTVVKKSGGKKRKITSKKSTKK